VTDAVPGVVRVVRHGPWSEVVLNRPERRNAIIAETVDRLRESLDDLGRDGETAAVVLRGEGGVFCSGLDLGQAPSGPKFAAAWAGLHRDLASFPVITIGALEVAAVAGGASLALACDLLIAGRNAFLSVPELAMGRPAPMNTAWLVYKHGLGRAAALLIGAQRTNAEQLLASGIAFEVVDGAQVVGRACELATTFAGWRRSSIVAAKDSLRRSAPRTFEETLDAVAS